MKAKTVAKNLTLILHALNSCNIVYKEDKTKQKTKNQKKKMDQDGQRRGGKIIYNFYQEPITRSSHLPYLPFESTLSRFFLFLEAPPTGFFAGVYIIANHKRAVVLYCLCHMQAARKYFNNGEKRGKFTIHFLGCCANVSVFSREIKEPPNVSLLKIKRYGIYVVCWEVKTYL